MELVNRAAEQLFGVRRDDVVGKRFEDALSLTNNDGRTWAELNRPLEGPRIRTGVPAMIGAKMMLEGKWMKPGVWNMEQFDPDPFIADMNVHGLPVEHAVLEKNPLLAIG